MPRVLCAWPVAHGELLTEGIRMRRCGLFLAAMVLVLSPRAVSAALLLSATLGDYVVIAGSEVDSGWMASGVQPTVAEHSTAGDALAAARLDMPVRTSQLAGWAGASAEPGHTTNAAMFLSTEVISLPEEGEVMGTPLTLYAQLVVRTYGKASLPTLPAPYQLSAYVWPYLDPGPAYLIAPNTVTPISTKLGRPIELTLSLGVTAGTPAGASYPTFGAVDALLVLGFGTEPPPSLVPIPTVPGDATLDGFVDGADYTVWADGYQQTTSLGGYGGDFNRDGVVDGADYTVWADNYSPAPGPLQASPVPEPATFWLAASAGLCAALGYRPWRRSLGR